MHDYDGLRVLINCILTEFANIFGNLDTSGWVTRYQSIYQVVQTINHKMIFNNHCLFSTFITLFFTLIFF